MEFIKNKTWLIKVPEIVYNQMMNTPEIGVIDIIPTTNSAPKVRSRLTKNFKAQNFNIFFDSSDCYMYFKEKRNKDSKIKKIDYFGRFVATDEAVSDNVTKQVAEEQISNTPSVLTDTSKGRQNYESHNLSSIANALNKKRNVKKEIPVKKTRMPVEDLKTEIFNMFCSKSYLTAKEIGKRLQQPESYLKQVLSEICDYIRTGPQKGNYELKRQFLKSNDERNQNTDMLLDE